MAFSVTSSMQLINPVYGPLPVSMEVTDSSVPNYMTLDIYVGDSDKGKFEGEKKTIRVEGESTLDVDIQGLVQPYFTSDASGDPQLKRVDIVGGFNYTDVSTTSAVIRDDKFSVLKHLNASSGYSPYGSLIQDGSILYGMNFLGGTSNSGVIFKMTRDGSSYSILKSLSSTTGYNPYGSLIQDGSTLYGMTYQGGTYDKGVIFRISRDGSTFTVLKHLDDAFGTYPQGDLTKDGSTLYGMTYTGGDNNAGVIFRMNRDGSSYIVLKHFDESTSGFRPAGSLILDTSTLYGMNYLGGTEGGGTIFKVARDGSSYTILKNFGIASGYNPLGSLIMDSSTLYGMTYAGGDFDKGVIFKINKESGVYSIIKHLDTSYGFNPSGNLVLDGSTLYGMCRMGGTSDKGTIFKVETNGDNYTVLRYLNSSEGSTPYRSLVKDGSTLYGTLNSGGTYNQGTIFKMNLDTSIVYYNVSMNFDVSCYCGNFYTFNGVLKENYNDYNYILNGSTNSRFLNNFDAPLSIHSNDPLNLHFLIGTYYRETLDSSTKIYDVSTSTFTLSNVSSTGTVSKGVKLTPGVTPRIYTWNINPSSLNNQAPDLSINANTLYYTIRPANNAETKVINITPSDPRFTPKRVSWVDSNGAINYFNFDLVKNNDIEVSRTDYPKLNGYSINKFLFGTEVKDNYSITSNWITEEESKALKELWYSPSVMIDGKYVILDMSSIDILHKKSGLINYILKYYPSDKYIVQKN